MAKHTPGPWRRATGACDKYGAVVADTPIKTGPFDALDEREREGYGGYLVAESIAPKNRPLIAAAPDLYVASSDAYKLLVCALDLEDKTLVRELIEQAERKLELVLNHIWYAESEIEASNG